jgi:hypothetical protein
MSNIDKPTAYTEKKSIGTNFLDNEPTGKSSGQQVLLPESTRRNRVSKLVTINVNSRERNVVSYPNTNQFRWRLKRDLKNIQSIRLIGGTVPADYYNINTGWNKFTLSENSIRYTITLNPGKYDGTSLAAELKRALNNSGLMNSYDVSISNLTNKLTIKRISGIFTFSLLFGTGTYLDKFDDFTGTVDNLTNDYLTSIGSPARILGFVTADFSDTSGTLIAPNPIDTAWFLNKVFLHINISTGLELNRIEVARSNHDPYTIIYLDSVTNGVKFLNKETDYPELEFTPAPLARLSLLEISLRDEFYQLLDTTNKEYMLTFEITHLD